MLFNSFHFLIFFPLVVGIFFALPSGRGLFLLAASSYFYMAAVPLYILVLLLLIIIDYAAGILIERAQGKRRKSILYISIVANCLLLFGFKYFAFAQENLFTILKFFSISYQPQAYSIVLPIGLSFHTFQSLSYTIEVYRGKQRAERNFIVYSLYILFFPQLVAGPIERPQSLLPQLHDLIAQKSKITPYSEICQGLSRMLWGFFKKVVVADRLAVLVNGVYNDPQAYSSGIIWLAVFFFSIQIYCDFSGYSDIAIGAAQVLGIKLRENFATPYFSASLREFWSRWHISLSSWFRDYLFIPLGGNRAAWFKYARNILVVFIVSGLWHGAQWTFCLWGLIHGLYYLCEKNISSLFLFRSRILGIVLTFIFVSLAWVLFRANDFNTAIAIFRGLLISYPNAQNVLLVDLPECLGLISFLIISEGVAKNGLPHVSILQYPRAVRWSFYYLLIFLILFMGEFFEQRFIYFQF